MSIEFLILRNERKLNKESERRNIGQAADVKPRKGQVDKTQIRFSILKTRI